MQGVTRILQGGLSWGRVSWIALLFAGAGCSTVEQPQKDTHRERIEIVRTRGDDETARMRLRSDIRQMTITARLPVDASSEEIFANVTDGATLALDLTMPLGPGMQIAYGDPSRGPTGGVIDDNCGFGLVGRARSLSLPTGSNHLLVDLALGSPDRYPANAVSCEYSPDQGTENPLSVRIRGCFRVREITIPTARLLDLAALPGAACGLHP